MVRIDTTVDAEADAAIRIDIVTHRGSVAAWYEAMSRWMLDHPGARKEIVELMVENLGGRMRRRPPTSGQSPGAAG